MADLLRPEGNLMSGAVPHSAGWAVACWASHALVAERREHRSDVPAAASEPGVGGALDGTDLVGVAENVDKDENVEVVAHAGLVAVVAPAAANGHDHVEDREAESLVLESLVGSAA